MQVTYPLDTLRLRIAVDPSMRGIRGASTALFREGSYNAFFRGLTASLIGTVLHPLLPWLLLLLLFVFRRRPEWGQTPPALQKACSKTLRLHHTASQTKQQRV